MTDIEMERVGSLLPSYDQAVVSGSNNGSSSSSIPINSNHMSNQGPDNPGSTTIKSTWKFLSGAKTLKKRVISFISKSSCAATERTQRPRKRKCNQMSRDEITEITFTIILGLLYLVVFVGLIAIIIAI